MDKKHIPFITLREDYNEYEVENGQVLKLKLSLVDITASNNKGDDKASFLGIKSVAHVITDVKIDTSALEYSSAEQVSEKDNVKELRFRTIKQVISVYETTKHLVMIAPSVEKIFETNKKDKTNSPILRYTYATGIDAYEKESLYKKPDNAS
jgi:hypothetical protein